MTTSDGCLAWAVGMCTLLDEIEQVADDEEAVRALCRARFRVAEENGVTIEFLGPAQIGTA